MGAPSFCDHYNTEYHTVQERSGLYFHTVRFGKPENSQYSDFYDAVVDFLGIAGHGDRFVGVIDDQIATQEHHADVFTLAAVTVENGCALIRLGEQAIRIAYDPAVFTPTITPVSYSAHMGVQRHLFTLDFHAMAQGALTARFTISPETPKKG